MIQMLYFLKGEVMKTFYLRTTIAIVLVAHTCSLLSYVQTPPEKVPMPLVAQELIKILKEVTPAQMAEKIYTHAKFTCELKKFELTLSLPMKENARIPTLTLFDDMFKKLTNSFDQSIIALQDPEGKATYYSHLAHLPLAEVEKIKATAQNVIDEYADSTLPFRTRVINYYQLVLNGAQADLDKRPDTNTDAHAVTK